MSSLFLKNLVEMLRWKAGRHKAQKKLITLVCMWSLVSFIGKLIASFVLAIIIISAMYQPYNEAKCHSIALTVPNGKEYLYCISLAPVSRL